MRIFKTNIELESKLLGAAEPVTCGVDPTMHLANDKTWYIVILQQ